MSAGQPPRPGFPGRMPVRAPLTPGAVPQRPGAVPGARPGLQPRPMMPGARPAMTPAGAQPAVRPVQPRPMAVGVAGRPPMPTVGARPTAAGTTLPGAVRPGVPSMSPAQPGLQQVRPGVVPRAAMQPRGPSPVGAGLPPGARPVGAPLMARPTVPGQPMPVAAGQRLPVGAPVRPGTPPLVRPATGAHAPAVRPAAGAPVPAMRPASPVRPAAGAPAPVMRPATVRPTVGAPMMRPGVGAPVGARPAAVPSPMGVRPSAAPTPAAVRPSAAPAPGGVRPAAAPAPGGVRPGFAPTPVGVRPTTAPAPGGVRPAAVQSPMGVRPATPPTPVGVRPTGPPAPGGVRPAVRPMAAPTPVRPATVAPAAVRPAAVAQVARPSTVAATPAQTPAAPPAVPPAQPVPGAGGDRVSTGDLNMDDIKETFRQVFQGQAPDQISRADPGSEGTPCKVRVNMYPVTLPKGQVFHYDIEIFSAARKGPEGTVPVPAQKRARCASTLVNREVVEAFSKCYQGELGGSRLAFDGRKNLFTRKLLPFTEHIFNNVEAEVNGEKCAFVVRIAYAATVSFDGLHAMYQSSAKKADQFQDAVQVADVILRTGPTLSFVPVGRSFFVESDRPINLTGDREVWFGFYSSIRLGAWKPLVNIDMSATAFYSPVPLIDFAVTVLKKRSKNDLKAGLNDRERVLLAREIRTLKVKVIHLESSRHFRIEGLTSKPASHETFEMGDQQITVAQYFLQKYNRTLEFPNLPCVTAAKGRTMLPIEVCTLVKGQHCKKKLDEKQTQNMIRQTALSPKDRFDKIARSTQLLKSTSSQICQEFDMALDTTPIEIEARVLKPPTITYGAQKKQVPRDGVWKVDTFNKPVNMEKWSVAILGRVGPDKHKKITDTFQQEGHKLGMKIAPPGLIKVFNGTSKPRQVLEEVKANNPDVEMTLIVLDPRSDYGLLKAEAETTDLCMKTQCVKAINIETKFNGMFAANLLQKINAKLGGRNNGVQSALPNSMKNPYMAIGIDVNHPGPGDTTPSIAAVVASMDPLPSKYYACTSVQLNRKGSRSEYVVETKSMVLECLMEFKTQNKRLPAHIFIFRDGVADAQFDAVRIYELGAIRKACLEIQSDYTPGMTFIVVQKRHHVRFAPAGGDKGYGRTGNIHAGTIVDSKIVNPAIFDFYLCSHQGIQGTSRAAHYHVVHDDVHHSPDEIYRICYNLCHTYARCPRAVSIPAPAYYAHLAAFRAKEHIKGRVQHGGTYAESSSGSVKSSSSSEPDLDKYQSAQKVLNQMRGTMYFV